tara:strand:- start:609 stop:1451 length:843 start_codon:yes stop_codon:yes gene_type:complete
MKYHNLVFKLFVTVAVLIGLMACNPEKKLAIEFASKAGAKNLLVIAPDYLFKTNLKTYLMDSLGIGDDENKDSILLIHSEYLSDLNDSLFIVNYMLGYNKALSSFGFRVFTQDQTEEFLNLDSNSYQVNIAQIEIEETLYTYRDEVNVYEKNFYHDHNLNAVYVNSWFEIYNLNDNIDNQQTYFTTDMISDIPDGSFDYDIFSGKVRYMYNIDSLKVDVLYDFAYRLGKEYAGYTFDFLLNDELNKKIHPDARSTKYWRYDPINHIFFPATDDKFIPLNE